MNARAGEENRILLTKGFSFEASHNLPHHKGACQRLHGHSYKLHVTVSGEINEEGMVADFSDIKEVVKKEIVDKLDHQYLNDFYENPTAEIMARDIFHTLDRAFYERGITVESVKLQETENSVAEYIRKRRNYS